MKDMNEKLILKQIYYSDGIDRASLAKKTNLSPASVTNLVSEMKSNGLVIEIGNAISTGGRRPILLDINPDYKYVIGIKIGYGYINFMLTDLIGTIKDVKQKIFENITTELVVSELKKQMKQWFQRYKRDFLGIGVAVSGVVDSINGTVINSYLLKWKNIKLSEILKKAFNKDVQILNDVDSFALAQLWFGRAKKYDNSVFLTLGVGIGGSVILNKRLLSSYGGVSEFGHMTIRENGNECNCGSRGCLEAEASFMELARTIAEKTKLETLKRDFNMMQETESSEIEFLERAKTSDKETFYQVFSQYSDLIGLVLKNIINIFKPEYLLIGGEAMEFSEYFYEKAIQYAKGNCFNGLSENLNFDKDAIGEDAWTLGCIYRVIENNILTSK